MALEVSPSSHNRRPHSTEDDGLRWAAMSTPDVSLQILPRAEGVGAARTEESLSVGVSCSLVVLEIVSPVERLVADITLVRTFPGMEPGVPVTIGPRCEGLTTVLTRISLVAAHTMSFEILKWNKHLLTSVASVTALCRLVTLSLHRRYRTVGVSRGMKEVWVCLGLVYVSVRGRCVIVKYLVTVDESG